MIDFAAWLSDTPLSRFIQGRLWVIPALQSIHILAIAYVLSSTLFINLRLLRRIDRSHAVNQTVRRFMPWIWFGLLTLLATGILLVIGEPKRELTSRPFWIKMALIIIGIAATLWFQITLRLRPTGWELDDAETKVRLYAFGTFLLWCAVIAAGRLIAYV